MRKKSYKIQMQTNKQILIMMKTLNHHKVLLSQLTLHSSPPTNPHKLAILEIFLFSFSSRLIFLLVQIASENNRSQASVGRMCVKFFYGFFFCCYCLTRWCKHSSWSLSPSFRASLQQCWELWMLQPRPLYLTNACSEPSKNSFAFLHKCTSQPTPLTRTCQPASLPTWFGLEETAVTHYVGNKHLKIWTDILSKQVKSL